jgi:hypothetical protein
MGFRGVLDLMRDRAGQHHTLSSLALSDQFICPVRSRRMRKMHWIGDNWPWGGISRYYYSWRYRTYLEVRGMKKRLMRCGETRGTNSWSITCSIAPTIFSLFCWQPSQFFKYSFQVPLRLIKIIFKGVVGTDGVGVCSTDLRLNASTNCLKQVYTSPRAIH